MPWSQYLWWLCQWLSLELFCIWSRHHLLTLQLLIFFQSSVSVSTCSPSEPELDLFSGSSWENCCHPSTRFCQDWSSLWPVEQYLWSQKYFRLFWTSWPPMELTGSLLPSRCQQTFCIFSFSQKQKGKRYWKYSKFFQRKNKNHK